MIPLFSRMALTLSGGGLRASAFHLGALAYLNAITWEGKPLLEAVRVLSTNSGGTITGLLYAKYAFSGEAFASFYQRLYTLLRNDTLFDRALAHIQRSGEWQSRTRSRNLINAFAEYYQQELFDNATFDLFTGKACHLESVMFNATEFNHGLPFRFQNKGKLGNHYFDLPKRLWHQIRLGDILAASTCFPGGFEPLRLPNDFGTTADDALHQFWQNASLDEVALMDGGVVDNQGINSIILEERRSHQDISLLIISDVQQWPGPFKFPSPVADTWWSKGSLRKVIRYIHGSVMLSAIGMAGSLVGVLMAADSPITHAILTLSLLFFSAFSALSLAAYFIKNRLVQTISSQLERMIGKKDTFFWKQMQFAMDLPLRLWATLIDQRWRSFTKIVSDIFMNRITGMQIQEVLYDKKWLGRSVHNHITKLLEKGHRKSLLSARLRETIQTAAAMPTLLWFRDVHTQQQMLDKLIASGQATLNYVLSEGIDQYRNTHQSELSPEENKALAALYLQLHEDWEKFNRDPFWAIPSWSEGPSEKN